MKIVINLKDPDGVYQSMLDSGFQYSDAEHVEAIDKFIGFLEYVSIEIDTETKTAKVLEC